MNDNKDDPSNNNNNNPPGGSEEEAKAIMKEEAEESSADGDAETQAPVVKSEEQPEDHHEEDHDDTGDAPAEAGAGAEADATASTAAAGVVSSSCSSSYQYQDRSRDASSASATRAEADGGGEEAEDEDAAPPSTQSSFPVKLHRILSNPEFQDIVCWLPHGRAWRILQLKAFEDRVLPLYFRHGRHASFARQVNGWGFRRIRSGPDFNAYYHELFLRGHPRLCKRMKRLTSKDIANRHQEENPLPDFYALSREHPLPEVPERRPAAGRAAEAPLAEQAVAAAPPSGQPMGDAGGGRDPVQSSTQVVAATASPSGEGSAPPQLSALEARRSEIVNRLFNLLNCTQGEALLAAVGLSPGGTSPNAAIPNHQTVPAIIMPSLPPSANSPSAVAAITPQQPPGQLGMVQGNPAPSPEAQTLTLLQSLIQGQAQAAAVPQLPPVIPPPAPPTNAAAPTVANVLALIAQAGTAQAPAATQPYLDASNQALSLVLQPLVASTTAATGSQASNAAAPQQQAGFQLPPQALQLRGQQQAAQQQAFQVQQQQQQPLQFAQQQRANQTASSLPPPYGDLLRHLQSQATGTVGPGFAQSQAPSVQVPVANQPASVGHAFASTTGTIDMNQILNIIQQGNHQQQQQQQQEQELQRQRQEQERQRQQEQEEQQRHAAAAAAPPNPAPGPRTADTAAPSQAPAPNPQEIAAALSVMDPTQAANLIQQLQSQLLGGGGGSNIAAGRPSPPPCATTVTGATSTTATSSESDNQGNRQGPSADGSEGGVSGSSDNDAGGATTAVAAVDPNSNASSLVSMLVAAMSNAQQNKQQ